MVSYDVYFEIKKMMKNMIKIVLISMLFSCSFAHAKESLSPEQIQLKKDQIQFKQYIPQNYVLYEAVKGDLNKDRKNDLVLIVKATDPKKWIDHEYRGKLDRNRRGIMVFLNEKNGYKKVVENLYAFSSENEEGGVYYAPELWFEIKKNNLYVRYAHGRYGWWGYTFRLDGQDLRLIGYDSSDNHGPYVQSETSVNFITSKKVIRQNTNEDPEGDPKFKEKWSKVNTQPIYLSKIKDFDELDFE